MLQTRPAWFTALDDFRTAARSIAAVVTSDCSHALRAEAGSRYAPTPFEQKPGRNLAICRLFLILAGGVGARLPAIWRAAAVNAANAASLVHRVG
jgi:hypothetical protein